MIGWLGVEKGGLSKQKSHPGSRKSLDRSCLNGPLDPQVLPGLPLSITGSVTSFVRTALSLNRFNSAGSITEQSLSLKKWMLLISLL